MRTTTANAGSKTRSWTSQPLCTARAVGVLLALVLQCYTLLAPAIHAQSIGNCVTPEGNQGICVMIEYCPSLTHSLKVGKTPTQEEIQKLRAARCGMSENRRPRVCCGIGPANDTLPLTVCGKSGWHRIVNGHVASLMQFPWMAMVAYNTSLGDPEFRCAGTLIQEEFVLTAAHCLRILHGDSYLSPSFIRLGELDLRTPIDCLDTNSTICGDPPVDIGIKRIIVHENFTSTFRGDDIALLQLNKPINYTNFIRPICLPVQYGDFNITKFSRMNGQTLIVSGWGRTVSQDPFGENSPILLFTKVPVVNNSHCESRLTKRVSALKIDEKRQICAGGKGGTDSCGGDSGGPLSWPESFFNKTRAVQHGIVSYGLRDCAEPDMPAVYTRVAPYIDWILQSIQAARFLDRIPPSVSARRAQ